MAKLHSTGTYLTADGDVLVMAFEEDQKFSIAVRAMGAETISNRMSMEQLVALRDKLTVFIERDVATPRN